MNSEKMLRAHMTCHDVHIISSGLDTFLTVGDVYRRDSVDRTHYPVFHQMDGVRLFTQSEVHPVGHVDHAEPSVTIYDKNGYFRCMASPLLW